MAELITRKENAVGWVIFSNPAKFNAVSHDMWMALPKAIAAFDADPEVRLIVITGDGDKAFISGADISQFEKARGSAEAQAIYNQAVVDAYEAPVLCSKPVVAKIRGICMGGGLGLAAACDVRIAAADAVFRMPAGRLGLGYNYTGIRRFVQMLGAANTADIFFSARKFDAADALGMGFVNRVVPVADFDREVAAIPRWWRKTRRSPWPRPNSRSARPDWTRPRAIGTGRAHDRDLLRQRGLPRRPARLHGERKPNFQGK